MKHYAPLFSKLCFLLPLVISSKPSKADHIAGTDITYTCTSQPGVYEITLYILRDCAGVPLCSTFTCPQNIDIMGVDLPYQTTKFSSLSLSLISVRDASKNGSCPNIKNTCTNLGTVTPGTFTPAMELYEFKGFLNLGPTSGIPAACCNIRMAYTMCCRIAEINTGSSGQNFYTEAIINRCLSLSPCNSSPERVNDPFETFCMGVPFTFSNAVSDPELDSLSFEFVPSLLNVNSSATYTPPFAYNKPMPWTGNPTDESPAGIRCDPLSGDVSFTSPQTGTGDFYGNVSIGIKQWKTINGKPTIIGMTRREILLVGLAGCIPNNPPRLVSQSSNVLQPNWEVCAGEQLCFTVTALDTDFIPPTLSDTTYLSWDRSLAKYGATFLPTYSPAQRKLNGPREDSYRFCWTPADNLASLNPYYFTVTAKDTRCPNPGISKRAISIRVKSRFKLIDNVSLVTTDSGCGSVFIKAIHSNFPGNTFQRFVDVSLYPNDPTFTRGYITYPYTQYVNATLNDSGTYSIRYRAYDTANTANQCSRFLTVSDAVYNPYRNPTTEIVTTQSATCAYSSDGRIQVKATAGLSPFVYAIETSPFSTDTFFNNLRGGIYTLRIKDSLGCIKVVRNVEVRSAPRVFGDGTLYADKSVFYAGDTVKYWVGLSDFRTSGVSWNLTNGTALSAPGTDHITVKWNRGPASIQALGTNKGCFDTVSLSFTVANVGVAEEPTPLGVSIFPNPTHNVLTVSLQNLPENKFIDLYDVHGKLVLHQELKLTQEINLQELPQGMYVLNIGDWHGKISKN